MSKKMATIWNPKIANSKKVWEVGKPMPSKGFQLWTGGKASQEKAIGSIKQKAATNLIIGKLKTKLESAATKKATARTKAAGVLRKQTTHIGETNWKALQKKYHPKQLEWATEIKAGERMWKTGRRIADFKHDSKEAAEIKKIREAKK